MKEIYSLLLKLKVAHFRTYRLSYWALYLSVQSLAIAVPVLGAVTPQGSDGGSKDD
jgi:hypothetical protein